LRTKKLEEKVRETVDAIIDPETGLTLGEMKLIRQLKEERSGSVRIEFRPSNPFCPIALKLGLDIKNAALGVDGVDEALVCCQGHVIEETINRIINSAEVHSQEL